jgi:hypothetical protein
MTSVELVRSNAKNAWSRDVNQLIDVSRGNLGGYLLLRGYDGTRKDAAKGGAVLSSGQYPLDVQSPGGKHAAFVHSSTAAAAAPTSANAVVLITDDGLGVGHGAGLRLYETGGVDYAEFTSVDGGVTVGGSGAQAGAVGVQKLRVYEPVGGDFAELTSADGLLLLGGLGAFGGALSILGDLAITGVSKRITGDFSNAAAGSRLSFQSSTVNGATQVNVLPNGAGTISGVVVHAGSNPAAAAYGDLLITATELRLYSGHTGAAYLPISVYTGGARRLQVDTTGNLLFGTVPATVGLVRLPTTTGIYARNWANTADILLVSSDAASQVNVGQAGTNTVLFGGVYLFAADPPTSNLQVTAQSQCKAWAFVTAGGGASLSNSYNCSGVVRNGAGDFTISWNKDFTSGAYALVVSLQDNGVNLIWRINGQSAGSADIHFRTTAGVLTDPDAFGVVAFGTL